jgi:hypothetical protein
MDKKAAQLEEEAKKKGVKKDAKKGKGSKKSEVSCYLIYFTVPYFYFLYNAIHGYIIYIYTPKLDDFNEANKPVGLTQTVTDLNLAMDKFEKVWNNREVLDRESENFE